MKRTILALALLTCAAAGRADDALQAGFGEADITPTVGGDKPVYMAGFGHNRKATGVHDRLKARAVVLKSGPDEDRPGLRRSRRLLPAQRGARPRPAARLRLRPGFQHAQSRRAGFARPVGPTPFQSGVDPDYLQIVEKQIVQAVRDADAAVQPVAARIGSVKAPELLHDDREPYVKHDELVALEFRTVKDDKPAGLVVQWNCHPETLGSKNTEISADFVGYTVSALQDAHHCPVVYLTGTVGGLMTSLGVEVKEADGKELKDGTFEKTERYGRLLAEAADKALQNAQAAAADAAGGAPVDGVFAAGQQALPAGPAARRAGPGGLLWSGDPYKAEPADTKKDADKPLCVRTEVGYLRLGELDVAVIPGEIYPELVLDKVQDPPDPGADFPDAPIEPAIYKQLHGKHRMLIGLANDEIGYIIPKRQWDEKPPYCYGRKQAQYGEVNSLGPDTAPLLCQAFKELVHGDDTKRP